MGWTWYGWIFLISLLIAGIYALAELIAKKSAEAGGMIEKVSGLQGYVGIGLIVFSLWNLFYILGSVGGLIQVLPLTGIILIAALIVGILLGVFESIDLFKSWKILNEEVVTKVKGKLVVIKTPLGLIAVIASLYLILWGLAGWGF
jgi:hypothetical protein